MNGTAMNTAVRPIIFALIAGAVAVAAYIMHREQAARAESQAFFQEIGDIIDSGDSPTPDVVQAKRGRAELTERSPDLHTFVEEYTWTSPLGKHIVYVYYRSYATKLAEAISIDKKLEKWESGVAATDDER
jgi:hypothetical protein